jgi:hypothetical protein
MSSRIASCQNGGATKIDGGIMAIFCSFEKLGICDYKRPPFFFVLYKNNKHKVQPVTKCGHRTNIRPAVGNDVKLFSIIWPVSTKTKSRSPTDRWQHTE